MDGFSNITERSLNDFIDGFIRNQVVGRGLDERTEKAYRLDLEHFHKWMEKEQLPDNMATWQMRTEQYINYLLKEKGLRTSTVSRKNRVFGYFLTYLAKQGAAPIGYSQAFDETEAKMAALGSQQINNWKSTKTEPAYCLLSKSEVDAFFEAIRREREEVDSAFRRRLCVRDQVMMGLLFYHGIDISELLKIDVSDYNIKSGILTIPKKREKECSVRLFCKELRDQMKQWLDEHEYFERDEKFQDRLFLSKMGRPLSMKMVILIFEKYRVLAGIEREFTPKDLKRSLSGYGQELVREQCR